MQVEVYDLTAKKMKRMSKVHADILVKMKRATYEKPKQKRAVKPKTVNQEYSTRMLTAEDNAATTGEE